MISIIICSVNPALLEKVTLNIGETIGVPFEIIAVDNRSSNEGICTVYNRAGRSAKFDILCFLHEDILFRTRNWGSLLEDHFKDPAIGLLGVAGGDSMGTVPSTWSTPFRSREVNLIQHYKSGEVTSRHLFATEDGVWKPRKKALVLDGLFLCTRKALFDQYKFDETHLPGFHGYDIDYSLQLALHCQVVVVFDILISHFSEGRPNRQWMESILAVHHKWKKQLPVSVHPLTAADFRFYHWKLLQVFIEHLFRLHYSRRQILSYYLRYSFGRYFVLRRFLSMGKYVSQLLLKQRPQIY